MPIPMNEAHELLNTIQNVSGNARARARARVYELLTNTDAEPEGWREEREAMQATIDRQRQADERSLAMLAECRKLLADMTAQRDAALATRGRK